MHKVSSPGTFHTLLLDIYGEQLVLHPLPALHVSVGIPSKCGGDATFPV